MSKLPAKDFAPRPQGSSLRLTRIPWLPPKTCIWTGLLGTNFKIFATAETDPFQSFAG
jgi:hypothetical protein